MICNRAETFEMHMNDLNRWKNQFEQQWQTLPRPQPESTLLLVAGVTVLATALTVALTWTTKRRRAAAQRLHDVHPVYEFDAAKFAGSWQEYAHITPSGQQPVSDAAMYLRELEGGSLQLSRRRYSPEHQQWHTEERTLNPIRTPDIGAFQSEGDGKNRQLGVVVLDPHYRWAMVVGETVDELWLLVRPDTKLPTRVFNQMLSEAQLLGFDTTRVHLLSR